MARDENEGQNLAGDSTGNVEKPVFGVGESGTAPLAAVFKTRRRRKKNAGPAEPPLQVISELEPEDLSDLVLELGETSGDSIEIILGEDHETGPLAVAIPPAASPVVDTQPMAQFDLDAIDLGAADFSPFDSPSGNLGVDFSGETMEAELEGNGPPTEPPIVGGPRTTLEAPALEIQQGGLRSIVPPNADPTWARDQILTLASDYSKENRTPNDGAWFAEMFRSEYLLANPRRAAEHVEREVEYVERALNVASGGRIFDLCSGHGRHAVPFARRGYEVVGLDLSIDMLQHALARAQAESLSIKFVHGDMRDLNFEEVFDGTYCLDTSFGYFSEMENLAVLRGIWRGLKPGGRFVLDVVNRDYALQELPNRNWWEGDGCLVQEDIEFDYGRSRLQVKRYLVFSDGTERVYDLDLRLYSAHEILRMLDLAGFEVVDLCGGLDTVGVFFGSSSRRLLVTARRPA